MFQNRILIFLFFLVSVNYLTAQTYEPKSKIKQVDGHQLEVLYGDKIIFIAVDQMKGFDEDRNFQKLAVMAKMDGKPFRKNKVFRHGEEITKVSFQSSDTSILEFKPASAFLNQGFFFVKTVGEVSILAIFNETDTISVPVRVRALDIESRFTEENIVDFIGEPSRKNIKRIPYNTIEEVDGIVYNTEDLIKGMVAKHWMYDEYPGAILVIDPIDDKNHVSVKQPSWNKVANMLFDNI